MNVVKWVSLVSVALLLAPVMACTGTGGAAESAAEGSESDEDDQDTGPSCDDAQRLGHRLLRRLTRVEFEASVRHVFALDAQAWSGSQLYPDPSHEGYNTSAAHLTIDEDYANTLLASAEQIAGVITAPEHFTTLLPCADGGGEACAETFLEVYGTRLFRRHLDDLERARWLEIYREAEQGEGFGAGIYWLSVGLLGSPNFIYRHELGRLDGDVYTLEGHERATALAYTYTGHGPDDALIERGESGLLATKAEVEAAAHELVFDDQGKVRPAFRARLLAFVDQWLGLAALANIQKDPGAVPGFTAEVRDSMRGELQAFLDQIVFEEDGDVADLLTAPVTMLDDTLASYYGFGAGAAGAFVETERPPEWGIGLLAQGALLSLSANNRTTSPTHRGLFVQEKFLCFRPPPPPPGIADIPEPSPEMSTRERYELHTSSPACSGCHIYMDATGFAFEHLDAGGRYRATDGVHTIDDSAELYGHTLEKLEFEGPTALALELAELPASGVCVARHVGAYGFGVPSLEAACQVAEPAAALGRGEVSLLDFWLQLSATDHFVRRLD